MTNKQKGGEEMKTERVQIERTLFKDCCNVCGKEITGTSESQVNFNMGIHKQTQHNSPKTENGKA